MTEEILQGVTEELMIPEFIDVNWLKEQPQVVYRLDRSGHRYYYTMAESGTPVFYVSVTTFIKQTLPTSPFLIDWIVGMGKDAAKEYAEDRADYGTFLHMQCAHLLINAKYDLDHLRDNLMDYIEDKKLDVSFISNAEELKKDLLSFAQFAIEYNVVPVAVEIVLTHPEYGVAGAIDLVCEMDVEQTGFFGELYKSGPQKGKPKQTKRTIRQLAIVDIKSGKKGFYESSEIQLHCYRDMWNFNFPDIKIQEVFNWSPKEWRGLTPTFNLKQQTHSKNAQKLKYLVALAKIEDDKKNNSLLITHGEINLAKGLYANVESIDLSDLIKGRHDTKEGI